MATKVAQPSIAIINVTLQLLNILVFNPRNAWDHFSY